MDRQGRVMPPALGAEGHGPRQVVGPAERTPASGPMVGPPIVDMAQDLVLMEGPHERRDDLAPVVPELGHLVSHLADGP
jgi:hypothetical protein